MLMDNSANPTFKITAVIPAYNNGDYLCRSINSVLAQTRPADEIIVVDDGSTDGTAEKIKSFGLKVKYLHQNNAGASAARNTGIQAATGNWIAFLDADDEWLPHHLQTQVDLLARNPHLAWSTGNYYRCLCEENRRKPHLEINKAKSIAQEKDTFQNYFHAFFRDAGGCTDTMLIKKSALLEAGLFNTRQPRANDMDMWWRIAYRWPEVGYVSEPLAIYHLNIAESISHTYKGGQMYTDLLTRHLRLAKQHEMSDHFEPCAARMIHSWIRSMLFDQRAQDIQQLLELFDKILSWKYRSFIKLLITFPRLTALGCHSISKIVRTLHLRKQLVRRPQ